MLLSINKLGYPHFMPIISAAGVEIIDERPFDLLCCTQSIQLLLICAGFRELGFIRSLQGEPEPAPRIPIFG